MKIQIYSDIHLELLNGTPLLKPLAPYLFLAGDIGKLSDKNKYELFFNYCSKNFKQVYYVLGNHEFYHSSKTYIQLLTEYKDFFANYDNIYLLDDDYVHFIDSDNNKYTVYGSTLWSCISGKIDELNDFNMIKMKNGNNYTVPINQIYFNRLFVTASTKLVDFLQTFDSENSKLIVLTHFPPVRKTTDQPNHTSNPKYDNQDISLKQYFANNIFSFINLSLINKINYWISGHTHYSYDFVHHNTRYISNQIGYDNEQDESQHKPDGLFEF